MFKFLTGFWFPVLLLLLVAKPAAVLAWVALAVLAVPAWLLYCLLAD
ncbi:hypothetical protein [Ottowia sp.]|nr:hypothetical protein [Ottowia sp.]